LVALAEQARAQALKTGFADPNGLVRLESVADRAVRRLGLPREVPATSAAVPTLAAYAAATGTATE
jgi:hypothetical protein